MEISHRSKQFEAILDDAQKCLKGLLAIPDNYKILFLQGGARLQFSMVPMNLLRGTGVPADYLITGSWGKSAREEAVKEGEIRTVWDGKATNYDRLPKADELSLNPQAAYVHVTSNETIEGVQFSSELDAGNVPLVCDASSDFLHRPLDINRYGLIYAGAQKNAGPAGVTLVIIRDDLLARSQDALPGYLNYKTQAKNNSLWNTPPAFSVYMVGLVFRWLQDEVGGLEKMYQINREKAQLLYEVIDASQGFYHGHSQPECRSLMNVTFRLPNEELDKKFLTGAEKAQLSGLKGHRSVGGMRASIYNAMPVAGVRALRDYMQDFLAQNAT